MDTCLLHRHKGSSMTYCSLAVPIVVMSLIAAITVGAPRRAHSADTCERKVPYIGLEITSLTMMCKAAHLAAGGFWSNLSKKTVHEGARVEKESKPTFWRIAISDDVRSAQVSRFNANLEALEAPVTFGVEVTPHGGLLLIKTKRERGTSPETISIDVENSSFVYSSQHVNIWYNCANIWYGACKPYQ